MKNWNVLYCIYADNFICQRNITHLYSYLDTIETGLLVEELLRGRRGRGRASCALRLTGSRRIHALSLPTSTWPRHLFPAPKTTREQGTCVPACLKNSQPRLLRLSKPHSLLQLGGGLLAKSDLRLQDVTHAKSDQRPHALLVRLREAEEPFAKNADLADGAAEAGLPPIAPQLQPPSPGGVAATRGHSSNAGSRDRCRTPRRQSAT